MTRRMRQILTTQPSLLLLVLLGALLAGCQMNADDTWNNPADPAGTNWHLPRIRLTGDTLFTDSAKVKLQIEATSANSVVTGFQVWIDGTLASVKPVPLASGSLRMDWRPGRLSEGRHRLVVKAIDATKLVGEPDTLTVTVFDKPPALVPIRDTLLAVHRFLEVALRANDSDDSIAKYYFDTVDGKWDSTSTAPTLKLGSSANVKRQIRWGARDQAGKIKYESFGVEFSDQPQRTAQADTMLSSSGKLALDVHALDLDSTCLVKRVLWATSPGEWSDSSDRLRIDLTKTGGGVDTVRWAVRNDRGILSKPDTFVVKFLPPPTNLAVQTTSELSAWADNKGTLNFTWSGAIAGFPDPSIDWILYLGTTGSLEQVYAGKATAWSRTGVDSGVTYKVRLVGKNQFGDSTAVEGSVTTKMPASAKPSDPWYHDITLPDITIPHVGDIPSHF